MATLIMLAVIIAAVVWIAKRVKTANTVQVQQRLDPVSEAMQARDAAVSEERERGRRALAAATAAEQDKAKRAIAAARARVERDRESAWS